MTLFDEEDETLFWEDPKYDRLVDVAVMGLSPEGMRSLRAVQIGNQDDSNYRWFIANDLRDLDEIADGAVALLQDHGITCRRLTVRDLEDSVTRNLGPLDRIVEATS